MIQHHTLRMAAALLVAASTAHLTAQDKPAAPVAAAAQVAVAASPAVVAPSPVATAVAPVAPVGVTPPAGYVIGADDVLTVVFWRDKDMSGDVTVRPDGKISLPLVNDIVAAGLTPDQLRGTLVAAASRYVEDPNATVVVKQINSRKVFITGEVLKPGAYPLTAPTSVLQLISMAGGLREYADAKNIVVIRPEKDRQISYRFNYKDVVNRQKLTQNIQLLPGDSVVVP